MAGWVWGSGGGHDLEMSLQLLASRLVGLEGALRKAGASSGQRTRGVLGRPLGSFY